MKQVTLTFTRYGVEDISPDGSLSPSSSSTFTAVGALEPADRSVQSVLPEGKSFADAKYFYTKTQVNAASILDGTPADTVVIGPHTYEVFYPGDFTTNLSKLAHYEVLLLKKEVS